MYRRTVARPILLLLVSVLASAVPAKAQDGYLFKQPAGSLNLRIGASALTANDDLFKFFTQQLTLNRSDFKGIALGADVAVRAASRADVLVGVAFDRSSKRSEFRNYVDQDDNPIQQTTQVTRVPITAAARFYLLPRGRTLGRHAWVPNTFTPYVGAGAGVMVYSLKQAGDWVDYQTLDVFPRTFTSSGAALTSHAAVGTDLWIRPSLGLNLEARYAFASGGLDSDFADFNKIDLRGFQLTTGISLRFTGRQ